MYTIIDLASAFPDGILLYIYFRTIFTNKAIITSKLSAVATATVYCFAHIAYYILSSSMVDSITLDSTMIRTSLTLTMYFLLSFMFRARLITRIFSTVIYMVAISLCEELSLYIITKFLSIDITSETLPEATFTGISLVTDLLLFLLTMIFIAIWKTKLELHSGLYSCLLLIVPCFSVILSLLKPFFMLSITQPDTYIILNLFLLIINIVNFILLDNVLKKEALMSENELLNTQVSYQKDKYQQLREAYKNIRSFMHDTKKHLFYIENCVKNEDYDLIIPYAQTTMEDLESRYCTINTGNLVIDSFVSNLLLQTKKHGITLHTNLKIDNNIIPLSDYHMTVILGNLLDNALNACLEQNDGTINLTIQTVEDTFTIHITNTYVCAPDNTALLEDIDNFDFIHGYGLKNVKTSTLYYHGVCLIDYKNDIYSVTVIIPLEC